MELLLRARELGLKGLAITDHGPALKSRVTSLVFTRTTNPLSGIRFIKGMECNVVDDKGGIDAPKRHLKHMDLILLGLHPNIETKKKPEEYTKLLITAIEKNPCIDIITHPNEKDYLVDFEPLANAAKKRGIALELNNSKSLYDRSPPEVTRSLICTCKNVGCPMAIGSDAHSLEEIGLDDSVKPFLIEEDFPEDLLVNSNAEKAFAFIEGRKNNKIVEQ
jgi:putative hydrolase